MPTEKEIKNIVRKLVMDSIYDMIKEVVRYRKIDLEPFIADNLHDFLDKNQNYDNDESIQFLWNKIDEYLDLL